MTDIASIHRELDDARWPLPVLGSWTRIVDIDGVDVAVAIFTVVNSGVSAGVTDVSGVSCASIVAVKETVPVAVTLALGVTVAVVVIVTVGVSS
ncbi:MAG: hypothetical protein ACRDHN_09025 [Thermomicrobiales bacterium]